MDSDNGSSLVGVATELLGDLLLGAMVLYGFYASHWVYWFPPSEFINRLNGATLGVMLLLAALIAGYVVEGIGFPIFHQWFFRTILGWDHAADLIRTKTDDTAAYKQSHWGKRFGRPKEFDGDFLKSLKEAINTHFSYLEPTKKATENPRQAFRLCWRAVGRYYRAAANTPGYNSFALRNLNLKCFFGMVSLVIVFVFTVKLIALALAIAGGVALLRQFVYFDGVWAKEVYFAFYAWHKESKTTPPGATPTAPASSPENQT